MNNNNVVDVMAGMGDNDIAEWRHKTSYVKQTEMEMSVNPLNRITVSRGERKISVQGKYM